MHKINYIVNSNGDKMRLHIFPEFIDEMLDQLNQIGVTHLTEDIVFKKEFKVQIDNDDGVNIGYVIHESNPLLEEALEKGEI